MHPAFGARRAVDRYSSSSTVASFGTACSRSWVCLQLFGVHDGSSFLVSRSSTQPDGAVLSNPRTSRSLGRASVTAGASGYNNMHAHYCGGLRQGTPVQLRNNNLRLLGKATTLQQGGGSDSEGILVRAPTLGEF